MMRNLRLAFSCSRGAAAVEMALVMPILLILMFGSVETGYYFRSEHVLQKGVRDAARYAARLPLTSLTETGDTCSVTTDAATLDAIRKIARTGELDGTDGRLAFWSDDATVSVDVTCPSGTYSTGGVYSEFPDGSPAVTVSATVAYPGLFGFLPVLSGELDLAGANLSATSQAAVMGS